LCVYDEAMVWTPEKIIKLRDDGHWIQQELADQLDASIRTVQAWEGGESVPSKRYARAMDRLRAQLDAPPATTPPAPRDLSPAALWALIDDLLAEAKRRQADIDHTDSRGSGVRGFSRSGSPSTRRANGLGAAHPHEDQQG